MSPETRSPAKSFLRHSQQGLKVTGRFSPRLHFDAATVSHSAAAGSPQRDVGTQPRAMSRGSKRPLDPELPPLSCDAKAGFRAGGQRSSCSGVRGSKARFHWKCQGKTNPLGEREGGGQARASPAAAPPGALGWGWLPAGSVPGQLLALLEPGHRAQGPSFLLWLFQTLFVLVGAPWRGVEGDALTSHYQQSRGWCSMS